MAGNGGLYGGGGGKDGDGAPGIIRITYTPLNRARLVAGLAALACAAAVAAINPASAAAALPPTSSATTAQQTNAIAVDGHAQPARATIDGDLRNAAMIATVLQAPLGTATLTQRNAIQANPELTAWTGATALAAHASAAVNASLAHLTSHVRVMPANELTVQVQATWPALHGVARITARNDIAVTTGCTPARSTIDAAATNAVHGDGELRELATNTATAQTMPVVLHAQLAPLEASIQLRLPSTNLAPDVRYTVAMSPRWFYASTHRLFYVRGAT